jgi:SAM-dependent methyltransferase
VQAEPGNADALCACGRALADTGHTELALAFLRQAIETAPADPRFTLAAVDVLQSLEFTAPHPWFEQFLVDCFDNPSLAHDVLATVATSLLWTKSSVQAALSSDPLEPSHLAALADEPLLLRLLSHTILRSWDLETLFVRLRRQLAVARDPAHLLLSACIAEQAFNAGFVQYQSTSEAAIEAELAGRRVTALTPIDLMVLAMYRPLIDAPGAAEAADASGWPDLPEPARRVIRRSLLEPLRERAIELQIPALTPIHNDVSTRVRAQYEEHPYPRWMQILALDDRNERLVDELVNHAMNFDASGWPDRPRVLVPGCGTGFHPLSLARRYPETDILAIDLSRASLAYAIRKRDELRLANVRFAQADLLGLGVLDERFDYIDCAGVLHHMASPLDGWRVLADLLKPGGVMRIGLYSAPARRALTAARDRIADLRIPGTSSAIRAFRQQVMTDPALMALRHLARTTADFFSMGDCRDMLFHVHEHCFDIPELERCLAALELQFAGMLLADRHAARMFHERNPDRAQWLDLARWDQFEAQYPDTFRRMYQFYCLKPGPRRWQ